MALRVATAAIGLPLLAAVVWLGGPFFALLALLLTLVAVWEFVRLGHAAGARTQGPLPYVLALLILFVAGTHDGMLVAFGLATTVIAALTWAVATWDGQRGDTSWLWTVGAALYVPLLLAHFLWMREWPEGAAWVTLALAGTFSTDTGAYATGKAFGRHKMAPRISPGKTWEGAAGGLAGGAVGTAGAAALLGLPGGLPVIGLGLGLSVAAQLGDLAESYLKRSARLKDAGAIVPGHGGLLDRLDSLVFAGPFVYYYAVWVMGAGKP